jgi:hypothetical protein
MWFTLLTQNTAQLHVDHNYAAQTEFHRPLVNSTFTLALVTGQSVTDVSQNVFANLGWDEVRLPNPVFEATRSTRSPRSSRRAHPVPVPMSASSPSERPATTRTASS